jgi:hypothetical protein
MATRLTAKTVAQDEGVGSLRQSTFTVNRTNFESGTLATWTHPVGP